MSENRQPGKLAVILHADIAGSTLLVQQDEHLAHERIQATFRRFSDIIAQYHGHVRELRGDALWPSSSVLLMRCRPPWRFKQSRPNTLPNSMTTSYLWCE